MASFYRTLTAPAQEILRITVRRAMVCPQLSLAFGRGESLFRVKTPTSHLCFYRETETVGGTYRKICGKVQNRYQDSRQRLIVALLEKVRCRGLPPRLKDTTMLAPVGQA